ncbi:3-deoxy-manno-octulosonate cytidylyltransferase [candidate division LCP-89 bacterium B3_LCP]|uniref:3-deoxy-manno-octulosonate cytidylyltransferase n=1 Tax=candidate division LCP-89 bacterium B3_LCP TaxID=2012998 RepID=A0A532UZX4_UNCL8|nr:MAG: 3-deoxy-manno-octulosonate cytidylyltransferase [candidate division LCP-89 bacterium B3_LCP]
MSDISGSRIPFGGEAVGIIPARCASTRFPDKPLALIKDIPMICWTWRHASQAKSLQKVIVAAEDQAIVEVVEEYGGNAVQVAGDFKCGSERVAALAAESNAPAIVNVQADEPFINPEVIDKALLLLHTEPELDVTTAYSTIDDPTDYYNPNCVKVVLDHRNRCLYFSRSPIPAIQGRQGTKDLPRYIKFHRHIGLYCYRKSALERFASLPQSDLERCEGLEQLRLLEAGGIYGAVEMDGIGPGVDTEEDLIQAEEYITERGLIFERST